jgi:hypothetical protein
MASKNSSTTINDMLSKRVAGIKKYLTDPNTTILYAGKQLHPPEILAVFQTDVDARAAVDTAHATVKSTITARKTADANRRPIDTALKGYIVNLYGATSVEAQEFGYPPPKPRTKTVAVKQAAIEKAAATRAARGTMGTVQKAEITGTVPVFSSPEAAAAAAKQAVSPVAGAPVVQPAVAGDGHAAPPAATPVVNGASH